MNRPEPQKMPKFGEESCHIEMPKAKIDQKFEIRTKIKSETPGQLLESRSKSTVHYKSQSQQKSTLKWAKKT
jgi:hypothetical protein